MLGCKRRRTNSSSPLQDQVDAGSNRGSSGDSALNNRSCTSVVDHSQERRTKRAPGENDKGGKSIKTIYRNKKAQSCSCDPADGSIGNLEKKPAGAGGQHPHRKAPSKGEPVPAPESPEAGDINDQKKNINNSGRPRSKSTGAAAASSKKSAAHKSSAGDKQEEANKTCSPVRAGRRQSSSKMEPHSSPQQLTRPLVQPIPSPVSSNAAPKPQDNSQLPPAGLSSNYANKNESKLLSRPKTVDQLLIEKLLAEDSQEQQQNLNLRAINEDEELQQMLELSKKEFYDREFRMGASHDILVARVLSYGLKERHVKGDGSCQFRALSDQLYGTEEHHQNVRRKVIEKLEQEADHYKNFVLSKTEIESKEQADEAFNLYLVSMSEESTWGDHVTLQAAADVYNCEIKLITSYDDDAILSILPLQNKNASSAFGAATR
ncbi:unnamed protein product, partial [Amoebophrya sp. A120]|eukprot:GSA120T00014625001.1